MPYPAFYFHFQSLLKIAIISSYITSEPNPFYERPEDFSLLRQYIKIHPPDAKVKQILHSIHTRDGGYIREGIVLILELKAESFGVSS